MNLGRLLVGRDSGLRITEMDPTTSRLGVVRIGNERTGVHVTADDLRWLVTTGGPAALQALGALPQLKMPPGPPTPPDEHVA